MRARVVALVAREPGLRVLIECLFSRPDLEVVKVFTHGALPAAEGGGARTDVAAFRTACDRHGVALEVVDGGAARALAERLPTGPLDILVSLSWRYLVPQAVLDRFPIGALNIHRGALPAYAGAEPVRRAIAAGERRLAITAHRMTAEIDAGDAVAEVWMAVPPRPEGMSDADFAEVAKARLVPLYAPLAHLALDAMVVDAGDAA